MSSLKNRIMGLQRYPFPERKRLKRKVPAPIGDAKMRFEYLLLKFLVNESIGKRYIKKGYFISAAFTIL